MAKSVQKDLIVAYRVMGLSYKEIADKTGATVEYVRNICFRSDKAVLDAMPVHPKGTCKYCGEPLRPTEGTKKRQFCCPACRDHYFNRQKKRTPHILTCEQCGNQFVAYGNPGKRFCSHECLILAGRKG